MWYFLVLCILCACQSNEAQDNLVLVPPPSSSPAANTPGQQTEDVKPDVYSLHIYSNVQLRYANTLVTSRVANKANVSKEVFFSVLLPETAFISGFLMEIDGDVYKAHVKEKEEARREYEEAVSGGQTAAHVAQSARNSNRFTVSVNIEPEKKVTFNLTYEELLKRELSLYNLEININPGQIVRDLLVEVKINESSPITTLKVPDLRESNEIIEENSENTIATVERPSNSSAIIRWAPTPEQQTQLNKDGVKGQLIVQYDVDRTSHPEQILVNEGYFVHFFAPENLPTLRKHVTFVLDVSGSMWGRKIEQLREAMLTILNDLRPTDFFSLIMFSTDVQIWDPENNLQVDITVHSYSSEALPEVQPVAVVPATPDNINKSKTFVSTLKNLYSTNIHGGLITGLKVARLGQNITSSDQSGSKPEPMIIFLTDGQPNVGESDPEKIVSSVTLENADFGASIFSLSFGNDADYNFLKKLSLRNSGFARKIYEASDAALQLKNFYTEIASPVLADVTFNYAPDQVIDDSLTKTEFHTFFHGSEIVVAGKLVSNDLTGNLTARSSNGSTVIDFEPCVFPPFPWPPIEFPEENVTVANATFMERLWAYLTIQQLLDKETENTETQSNVTSPHKDKALNLALKYSFVTPLTSLVVVKPNETSSADTESGDTDHNDLYGPSRFGSAPPGAMNSPPQYAPGLPSQADPGIGSGGGYGWQRPVPIHQSSADRIIGGSSPNLAIVSLDNVSWIDSSDNSSEILIPTAVAGDPNNKTLLLNLNETNGAYQQCHIPTGEPGHCRHLQYCVLNVFTSDVMDFIPYHCEINSTYIGVCCPDYLQPSVVETTSEDSTTAQAEP